MYPESAPFCDIDDPESARFCDDEYPEGAPFSVIVSITDRITKESMESALSLSL